MTDWSRNAARAPGEHEAGILLIDDAVEGDRDRSLDRTTYSQPPRPRPFERAPKMAAPRPAPTLVTPHGASEAGAQEEILLPLPARARFEPVTQFRSTLLASSLKSIRDHGHTEQYLALLPAHYHEAVRACIAGVWLPVELGLAHYGACDGLALPIDEQVLMGREVGSNIQATFFGKVLKLAKGAGFTPWECLAQYQRLWNRLLMGGGLMVSKVGSHEARLECHNFPFARIPYFRHAFRGVNEAVCGIFCSKAHAEEIRKLWSPSTVAFRISWS